MARKKDLAGLAALGALGMLLSERQDGSSVPVSNRVGTPVGGDDQYNPDVRAVDRNEDYGNESRREGYGFGTTRRPSSGGRTPASGVNLGTSNAGYDSTAMRPANRMRDDQYNPDVKQGLRNARDALLMRQGSVMGNPGGSYDAPTRLTSAQAMRQLDEQTGVRQGPTAGNGNSVDSTELSRNLSAMVNAGGPGGLFKAAKAGVGVAREFGAGSAAQKAYNQAQAARRAAEGFSPAEAQAAREAAELAARDAKVLNPNAWLAGPQGMKNFKKGGQVKKSATKMAVKMSASRRGDGIAQRGKTRGKMV
jgi:hypothetical protein